MYSQLIQGGKYLVVGGINTLVTYALYLLCLFVMSPVKSYSLTFCIGVLLSYLMNSTFVFDSSIACYKAMLFVVVYVFQYLVGVYSLHLLIHKLSIPSYLAPLFSVALTVPLGFLLVRLIFRKS